MIWPLVALSDISKVVTGSTPKKSDESFFGGDIPFVTPAELDRGLVCNAKQSLTNKGANVSRIVPKDSIMVCCIGSLGKVGITGTSVATNQQINSLIVNNQLAHPLYVYYFCRTLKNTLTDMAPKTTVAIVNKSNFSALKIPLPPLEIQKQIAAVLEKADQLRKDCQQMEQELDSLAQSVFIDMFGDPASNPKGWEMGTLGDGIDYIGDIGSNGSNDKISSNLKMSDEEDYALMIRTTNLNVNDFTKNLKYVSRETYEVFSKSKIFGGEIIMNKIGSAGKFWIMPDLQRPVSLGLNQLMIRLGKLDTWFVYYYLSTDYGKRLVQSKTRGATTKSITKLAVKNIPIPIPPSPMQEDFSKKIDKINEEITLVQEEFQVLDDLFNALMQKAFKGELNLDKPAA